MNIGMKNFYEFDAFRKFLCLMENFRGDIV